MIPPSIFPLGEAAVTLHFGNIMDAAINDLVLRLFYKLKEKQPEWVRDIVPAYASLTIHYSVFQLYLAGSSNPYDTAKKFLLEVVEHLEEEETPPGRTFRIPVCYSERYGPDLKEISIKNNIAISDIIRLHTRKLYRVYMIGFLPGFAYMGEVEEQIALPRKEEPRQRIPAGSVGIAGKQTGIYPIDSPGGWQIIGRTPVSLFNKTASPSVLFQPGDHIQFYSISEHEFDHYQERIA